MTASPLSTSAIVPIPPRPPRASSVAQILAEPLTWFVIGTKAFGPGAQWSYALEGDEKSVKADVARIHALAKENRIFCPQRECDTHVEWLAIALPPKAARAGSARYDDAPEAASKEARPRREAA